MKSLPSRVLQRLCIQAGLLLRDAVDVASSQEDFPRLHAHNLAPWIDFLKDLQGPAASKEG